MDRLRGIAASDRLSGRFSRYFIVGGSAAVVDLGGFVVLSAVGTGLAPAAAGSFALAVVYNFALSSWLVFRVPPTWRRFLLFATFALVGLVVNTGVTIVAASWLPTVLAKVVGIGVAFGVNFWINNSVVFHRGRKEPGPSGNR